MTNEKDVLEVNPTVARLADAVEEGPIVEVKGYVGPSGEGTVRLYTTLRMDMYLDIPEDAILHAHELPDGERVKVYVAGKARIKVVSVDVPAMAWDTYATAPGRVESALRRRRRQIFGGPDLVALPGLSCLERAKLAYEKCMLATSTEQERAECFMALWFDFFDCIWPA